MSPFSSGQHYLNRSFGHIRDGHVGRSEIVQEFDKSERNHRNAIMCPNNSRRFPRLCGDEFAEVVAVANDKGDDQCLGIFVQFNRITDVVTTEDNVWKYRTTVAAQTGQMHFCRVGHLCRCPAHERDYPD